MRVHTTGTILDTGDTTILDTGDTTVLDTGDPAIMATGDPSIMATGDTTIIRGGTTAGGDYRAPLGSGNTTMTMRKSPGVDRFL